MRFRQIEVFGIVGYTARMGPWNFLIVIDGGKYTSSYRLAEPKKAVSASSTIMGPFETMREAELACEAKWRELRTLQ